MKTDGRGRNCGFRRFIKERRRQRRRPWPKPQIPALHQGTTPAAPAALAKTADSGTSSRNDAGSAGGLGQNREFRRFIKE